MRLSDTSVICRVTHFQFPITWPKNYQISAASETIATARIAPEICQSQLPTMCSRCSRFHPNRFTFGAVMAERVNTVFFCPVEYLHYRLFESILSSWNSLKRYLDAEDRSYKRDTVGWGSWRRSARARVSSPSLLATSSISWRSLTLSDDDYALCRPTAAAAAATTTDGATSSPLHNASTASPPTPTLSRRHVLAILTHRVPKMSTRF